jgi:hypothetical protein
VIPRDTVRTGTKFAVDGLPVKEPRGSNPFRADQYQTFSQDPYSRSDWRPIRETRADGNVYPMLMFSMFR